MASSILCLGDSYTIGEGVPLHESFPYQLLQQLRNEGKDVFAPEIVAKTGWTSSELLHHLQHTRLQKKYEYATILIGVNNQYRGLLVVDFAKDFEEIVAIAKEKVDNEVSKIVILSIPNWGVTPFAIDRNLNQITKEIEAYNLCCHEIANKHNIAYVDITTSTLLAKNDASLLTNDTLHYSGKEHKNWVIKIKHYFQ
jgi:lysophospholipase L1-like esterase